MCVQGPEGASSTLRSESGAGQVQASLTLFDLDSGTNESTHPLMGYLRRAWPFF